MSVDPTEAPEGLQCLHSSPQRTVWRRREEAADEVHKVYLSGSSADSEHEAAMGAAAAGAGVVPHLGVGTDPSSGRPMVRQRFVAGQNLEAVVLAEGALPARRALALVGGVATTLARLHALEIPAAPRGLCHGDVKPQNLLATGPDTALLLDFEHARAIGAASDQRTFTGGTVAWSPPEAHQGATPDASFDVFGLGATLAFLLDGGTSRRVPRHPDVDLLIQACCDAEPGQRPAAAEVAARCERLAATVADDEAERHLDDWATGRCAVLPTRSADPRTTTWFSRSRLLERLPGLLEPAQETPSDPRELQAALEAVGRILRRFPRSPSALQRRRSVLEAVGALLTDAAASTQAMHKAERFDEAQAWLRTARALLTTAAAAPGGLAVITQLAPGAPPTTAQSAPTDYLEALGAKTDAEAAELATQKAAVAEAQRALDLPLADRHIDAMADRYGGTSQAVAEQRDQQHRLGFYLDRVARAAPNVERVTPLLDDGALAALKELVAAAAAAQPQREGGAVGLRSLQLTLGSVADEFPHLTEVAAALAALTEALVQLTDDAWRQLADAEQRLTVVPVPVRPLQLALGRLDSVRMLEALVDRPEQPRSLLLDGVERLRMGLEQARATRDRLTEDAEHALARGHWTTGLFEMERAVAGLNPTDDGERAEAERLQQRLQVARQTKSELESAVRRNVELNTRYVELEDDAHSSADDRLKVLQERRDCLLFLSVHVPSDRAELYRQDLRAVETQIALERAGDAERRLSALSDPAQRLRLASQTLSALGVDDADGEASEQSGRVLRLQQHWRTIARSCQQAVTEAQQEQQQQQRERRRMVMVTVLLALATTTALGFALKPWIFGEPVVASGR